MRLDEAKQILKNNGYLLEDQATEIYTYGLARSIKRKLIELGYKEHENFQVEYNEDDGYVVLSSISPFNHKSKLFMDIEFFNGVEGDMYSLIDHEKEKKEAFKMDGIGEIKIPVPEKSKHLKYDLIGKGFEKYDSILNLAHGKGHAMGGFGANLKNQSIGIASRNGKAYIHSCGITEDPNTCWSVNYLQHEFIESMAEAATAVADYCKDNNKKIIYITVANAISVDCDCDAHQGDPVIGDIGIFASTDPVANDQAFIDAIWATHEEGTKAIQERIDTRKGRHITEYAESLGLGTTDYELINID